MVLLRARIFIDNCEGRLPAATTPMYVAPHGPLTLASDAHASAQSSAEADGSLCNLRGRRTRDA